MVNSFDAIPPGQDAYSEPRQAERRQEKDNRNFLTPEGLAIDGNLFLR
jgi:hypothetical protein